MNVMIIFSITFYDKHVNKNKFVSPSSNLTRTLNTAATYTLGARSATQ